VNYCHRNCWLSWNAAKRAISYGYRNVFWFPDGMEGGAPPGCRQRPPNRSCLRSF